MSPFFHQCERGLGGALKAGCPAERDRYVSFSVWRNMVNLCALCVSVVATDLGGTSVCLSFITRSFTSLRINSESLLSNKRFKASE